MDTQVEPKKTEGHLPIEDPLELEVRKVLVERHNLQIAPEEMPDDLTEFDSIQTLEVVVGLEEVFGVDIEGDDLNYKNFDTISAVTKLLHKKLEDEENGQ